MNDIDILEEKIKNVKKYDTYTYTWTEQDIQAISNLIAENKELKEKNRKLIDTGIELATTIDALNTDIVRQGLRSKHLFYELTK